MSSPSPGWYLCRLHTHHLSCLSVAVPPVLTSPAGIVSAPLWDSKTSTFAGLLTTSDYINVIQYYWQNPDALAQVDQFRLNSLRDIEKAIGVQPIETVSVHPLQPLYTACRRMLESRARRIPLVDVDDETQRAMIVSVLTQYRIQSLTGLLDLRLAHSSPRLLKSQADQLTATSVAGASPTHCETTEPPYRYRKAVFQRQHR